MKLVFKLLLLMLVIASATARDKPKDEASRATAASQMSKDKRACLIVSQTGNWLKGETYQYQAGEFPPGVKFRVELRNRHLREIYRKGARVIVLSKNYSFRDLEDAKKSCTADRAEPAPQESR